MDNLFDLMHSWHENSKSEEQNKKEYVLLCRDKNGKQVYIKVGADTDITEYLDLEICSILGPYCFTVNGFENECQELFEKEKKDLVREKEELNRRDAEFKDIIS